MSTASAQAGVYTEQVPPSTGILKAMINADHMTLKIATAELIANSIEQNATEIDLRLEPNKFFWIGDNGKGCPDLKKMSILGHHYHTNSLQKISRYGVGLKDAASWMGEYMIVGSMEKETGKKEMMRANWTKMIASDRWEFEYENNSRRTSHGVSITVRGLRKSRFHAWNKLAEYIADNFSVAIDTGIVITVDGVPVKAKPEPAITDRAEFHGSHQGLGFKGYCGILKDRKSYESGWEVVYGPMAITKGYQKEGFGKYSPQGFYGRINLIDERNAWALTRNKTGAEQLSVILNCKDMQKIMKPILEKLKTEHRTLALRLNANNVQINLEAMLRNVKVAISKTEKEEGGKPRTRRGGTTPRTHKQGTGGTRHARKEDENSQIVERMRTAVCIKIEPHENPDDYGLGYVEVAEAGTLLKIYIDNSTVMGKEVFDDRKLLLHHAVVLLAEYFTWGEEQPSWINRQMRLFEDTTGCQKASRTLLFLLKNAVNLQPDN